MKFLGVEIFFFFSDENILHLLLGRRLGVTAG